MRRNSRRIITVMLTLLLSAFLFSIFWVQIPEASAQASASLTGVIYDEGVDTDWDGTFDHLKIGVEVNVTQPGFYYVEIRGLLDASYNHIDVSDSVGTYLDIGTQVVNLTLNGPAIYASGLNPTNVSDVYLYDEYYGYLDSLKDVPLSREYLYYEFDVPGAMLTGVISDQGVDADGDGTFDYLEVGVQVNVTESGFYEVDAQGLLDDSYNYIDVWDYEWSYLDAGPQMVNLTFDGPTIFVSGLNPKYVSRINLYDEYHNYLDSIHDTPLSEVYPYTKFDLPVAFLTGVIDDEGVDADGDGTFDYLDIGVEVNVTEPGLYEVSASGLLDVNYKYISVYDSKSVYLDVGLHVVTLSFNGPTIYASGLNPTNVSDISLYTEYRYLGRLHNAPLSKEYSYTEFDAPFTDAEVKFIVYPDGQVAIQGALNQTNIIPEYTGPTIYGGVNFTESGGLTMASAGFTFILPPEIASEFPFNSTTADLFGEYVGGLLTVGINATVILPPMFASQFPFNVTDLTLNGEYLPNRMSGTVTVHILSGFPLGDVDIDFNGNLTDISFNGSANVIYGVYNDLEINETSLPQLLDQINSTIPGQGNQSLYNMTDGLFEVTNIDYDVTPLIGGATVDFQVDVHGDIVQALTTLITPPGEDPDPIYSLLNSTFYSVESASIQLAYSHAQKEASMRLAFVVDVDSIEEAVVSLLPEIVPPEMKTLIESLLNTTFCSVESAEVSLSYAEGKGNLNATFAIEGDLNAEVNYVKNVFINYYATQMPLPWQMLFINETKIDVSNLRISLNLSKVSLGGSIDGLVVMPPIDPINATYFKLERFFNLTADTPFPGQNEKLKVTVEGGSNATHTIRIFRPETIPEPDISAPGGMIWNNQSISNLKDLIFQIGPHDNTAPEIGTPTHEPETPNPGEDVTVSVNVTDADTGVRPDGVILSYSTDGGGTWNNVTMMKVTGDTYEGIIQGLPAGTQVKYMIIAYDYENNEAVKDNAGNYYIYIVIPEFPSLLPILITLLVITLYLFAVTRTRIRTIHTTNFFSKIILASL